MITVAEGTDVVDATARLLADGIGDGLPVVPPTPSRVEAMLGDTADPDTALGAVPPLFGELTPRVAAYGCVLAGAPVAALPVVLAAARACLAPEVNLLGVATTTGTAAVALVVAGPVVERIGLTHGTGMLGPGPHTNGAVGRALALTLAVAGGARPGTTSMATTAQPARYTCCLAEDPSAPWDTLVGRRVSEVALQTMSVRDGTSLTPGAAPDAVTVLPIGGVGEVLPRDDRPDPDAVLDALADALAGAVLAAGDPARGAELTQAVVLPPEVAARVASTSTADDLVRALHTRGGDALSVRAGCEDPVVAAEIVPIVAGGPGVKMLHLPGWMGGSRAVTARL